MQTVLSAQFNLLDAIVWLRDKQPKNIKVLKASHAMGVILNDIINKKKEALENGVNSPQKDLLDILINLKDEVFY